MSITKDQLLLFIEKPGLLKEQTIGDLKEIVEEFPYFQSAQLLYTYNLHSQANFRYNSYLKICTIFATDRTILYRLLQPKTVREQTSKQLQKTGKSAQDSASLFELSEERQITTADFPEFVPKEPVDPEIIDFDLLSFDQQDALFQLDESDQNQENETVDQDETKAEITEEKVDLLEKFIKVNPTIQPRNEIAIAQNDLSDCNFISWLYGRIHFDEFLYQINFLFSYFSFCFILIDCRIFLGLIRFIQLEKCILLVKA